MDKKYRLHRIRMLYYHVSQAKHTGIQAQIKQSTSPLLVPNTHYMNLSQLQNMIRISLRSLSLFLFLFLCEAVQALTASSPCYFPSGEQLDDHTPCNQNASVSHCCKHSDACISNGYCFQQGGQRADWGLRIARSSCTDRSFNSEKCPQFCKDGMLLAIWCRSGTDLIF